MKQFKLVDIYCAHCGNLKPTIKQCKSCGSFDNRIDARVIAKYDSRKAFTTDDRQAQPQ